MTAPLNFADEAHAAGAYIDPIDPEQRKLIGSTTVIKKALPPYLVPWAAKLTATEAVDTIDSWSGLDRAAAIDLLKRAPDRNRDSAGAKGTIVHRVLELAATGQTPDEVYDAKVAGYISAGLRFLDEWQPTFVWNEASVFHPELGYAGTLDFIARLPGLGLAIGDYKTSNGVYPEVAVQLASYRYADHAVTHGPAGLERLAIPEVDGGVVVHIKGDGTYQLRPVGADEQAFEVFTHCLAICDWKARRGVVAPAQPAPQKTEISSEEGGVTAPSSPSSDDHLDWLKARVRTIVEAQAPAETLAQYNVDSAAALMAAWWPEGVPTLRDGGHTADQLDAIAERAAMVEKALGLPFPDPTPAEDADNVRVMADDPWVLDIVRRLHALPADLLREVESRAAGAGITSKVTLGLPMGKLRSLDAIVDDAEIAHRERMVRLEGLLADFEIVERSALCAGHTPAAMTEGDVDQVELLGEALATGYLVAGQDGLVATARCEELLVLEHGNRRDALNHTKRLAKAHGHETPKSFAEILGDPHLVALCIAEADQDATAATAVA